LYERFAETLRNPEFVDSSSFTGLKIKFDDVERIIQQKIDDYIDSQLSILKSKKILKLDDKANQELSHTHNDDSDKSLDLYSNSSCNSGQILSSKDAKSTVTDLSSRRTPKFAVRILESWFIEHSHNPYPTSEQRLQLAAQTELNVRQIKNWFIEKRAKSIKIITRTEEKEEPKLPETLGKEEEIVFRQMLKKTHRMRNGASSLQNNEDVEYAKKEKSQKKISLR